jgi:hypothetical protein
MRSILSFGLIFSLVFLGSCALNPDWGAVIIPADQELTFFEPDSSYGSKQILVFTGQDTVVIDNINQVEKICYFKLGFPEKDIIIEYVIGYKDGKALFSPRFIKLQ